MDNTHTRGELTARACEVMHSVLATGSLLIPLCSTSERIHQDVDDPRSSQSVTSRRGVSFVADGALLGMGLRVGWWRFVGYAEVSVESEFVVCEQWWVSFVKARSANAFFFK